MATWNRSNHQMLSTQDQVGAAGLNGTIDAAPKNVTKRHLVQAVSERTGLGKHEVQQVVEALMNQVVDEVRQGRRIEIRDFGICEIRVRSGRTAQNPKTLEPVPVPPKCTIRFKPGKSMREALDDLGLRVCPDGHEAHPVCNTKDAELPLVEVVGGSVGSHGRR